LIVHIIASTTHSWNGINIISRVQCFLIQHNDIGTGAGYAAAGGTYDNTATAGGATYGMTRAPTGFGSGGGNGASINESSGAGGAGGGYLQLNVLGTLLLEGEGATLK